MDSIIDRARGELGAALAQQSPSDDRIIMDHVRKAYELLGAGWFRMDDPDHPPPMDGTPILAPCGYGNLDVMVYGDGGWRETGNYMLAKHQPDRWMPLPRL